MSDLHELKFNNKIYNRGVNYTVRKGKKWSDRVRVNDSVAIEVPMDDVGNMIYEETGDNNVPFEAVITEVGTCLFKDLPERVFKLLHNPGCRDKRSLEKAMTKAYGEHNWDDEIVTYLGFIVLLVDDYDDEWYEW